MLPNIFWKVIVICGMGLSAFLPAYAGTESEVDSIHDYIIYGAHQKWEEDHASDWWQDIRDWSYEVMANIVDELGLI